MSSPSSLIIYLSLEASLSNSSISTLPQPSTLNMPALWSAFTARERRDIGIYIFGIMCYKFALEYYNGAFITLANERFPTESKYTKVAMLTGINAAMQCVSSFV